MALNCGGHKMTGYYSGSDLLDWPEHDNDYMVLCSRAS